MGFLGTNFPSPFLAPGRLEEEVRSTQRLNRSERKRFMDFLFGGIEELADSEYEYGD